MIASGKSFMTVQDFRVVAAAVNENTQRHYKTVLLNARFYMR
jgi:hypothetical protein